VVPAVLSSSQILAFAIELTQANPRRCRAGAQHILSFPAVLKIASDPRFPELAPGVLGPTATPFAPRCSINRRPPTSSLLGTWTPRCRPRTERISLAGVPGQSKAELLTRTHRERRLNRSSRYGCIGTIPLHLTDRLELFPERIAAAFSPILRPMSAHHGPRTSRARLRKAESWR
jgi:hypothetical protein